MPNANPPIGFLDNNFHDPDLDRFIDRVHGLEPEIAVIGDAYDRRQAESLQEAADALQERYDDLQCVTVPKCREAFNVLDDVVLGYPNGYSTVAPAEYSDPVDWRGRDIHVLGGNPLSQYEVMQELTQPTLAGHEPANIVGVDGNGVIKAAYMGEYWTPNDTNPLTISVSVKPWNSLYWKSRGSGSSTGCGLIPRRCRSTARPSCNRTTRCMPRGATSGHERRWNRRMWRRTTTSLR